ncbi:tetratricopeptide (TPR) repeat protein [Symbiobacterium terraclitae]|uniref:Tetratricopeptide (TPR) repeat protein n=1 Tax=Symbiobacterium terraclitae TaxID=557451 RepID=A0ABS4JW14_9FIRM|nr:bacterial transcriptional activator domain-containing protein [Symbiobacterium terraclitae]MBP2018604.1 tetratricopeptide (TPR) repeat protein [Symbiobacterium terraclitae]
MMRKEIVGFTALAGLALGAFWDGLYAPGQQMAGVALAALVALAAPSVRLAPSEWLALLLLAAGSCGALIAPAALGAAAHGPVLAAGWVLAFVAGRAFRPGEAEPALARFWAVTGALLAFSGALLISFTPPHHSGRLASFLGYPIAVGMAGLLGLAGALPDLAAGRPRAAFLALGATLGALLSGSRGVWAAAALLGAFLAWAAPRLLREALPRAWPALLVGLTAALWAAPAVQDRDAARLWPILLLALLTVALALRFQRSARMRFSVVLTALPALVLAPGWGWLLGRASALPLTDTSSAERLIFLRDGLALAAKLPLGAGYRAWSALHLQAARYPYYAAEVHSSLLDVALAYGWAGAAGVALLTVRFLLGLRHARSWPPARAAALGGLGVLAVHALVDWELSYGLFALPLWFGFGLLGSAPVRGPGEPGPGKGPAPPAGQEPGDGWVSGWTWPRALTVALSGLALAGSLLLGAGDAAVDLAARSLERGSPEAALRHAGAAVALTPWNDLAHAYKGAALIRSGRGEEGLRALDRARALGPREPWYAALQASELGRQERWEEASAAWADYVRLWPWETEAYAAAVTAHLEYIGRARAAGDAAAAARLAERGLALLDALERQKALEPPDSPRRGLEADRPLFATAREQFAAALAR